MGGARGGRAGVILKQKYIIKAQVGQQNERRGKTRALQILTKHNHGSNRTEDWRRTGGINSVSM